MAINAFLSFFDKADGESIHKGKEKWVEVQGWAWDVEAESSWNKGGGASIGKPNPGRLSFQHNYDTSSTMILGLICSGKPFPKVELQLMADTGSAAPETYLTMTMEAALITKVANAGSDDGRVVQTVDMVFKSVKIDYRPQDQKTGKLGAPKTFSWDIPSGTASPS